MHRSKISKFSAPKLRQIKSGILIRRELKVTFYNSNALQSFSCVFETLILWIGWIRIT